MTGVEQLLAWSGVSGDAQPTHRSLTERELEELARSPAVEVGAHTVTHSALATLPREAQPTEIVESKRQLEARLALEVPNFAYPFGTLAHYTAETVIVPDVGGDRFDALLRGWHGD